MYRCRSDSMLLMLIIARSTCSSCESTADGRRPCKWSLALSSLVNAIPLLYRVFRISSFPVITLRTHGTWWIGSRSWVRPASASKSQAGRRRAKRIETYVWGLGGQTTLPHRDWSRLPGSRRSSRKSRTRRGPVSPSVPRTSTRRSCPRPPASSKDLATPWRAMNAARALCSFLLIREPQPLLFLRKNFFDETYFQMEISSCTPRWYRW